ncbi:MAG: endonuclease [Crocinitomicaceae bacterium]
MKIKKIAPLVIIGIGALLYSIINTNGESETTITDNDMKVNINLTEAIIGFYNVENLFDIYDDPNTFDDDFTPDGKQNWDTKRYQTKLKQIGEMISSIDSDQLPAVMGFSEVENYDVLKDLTKVKALKKAGYEVIHKDSPDGRGIDVAAIYRPEAFKAEKYSFYNVILPGKDKSTTRDILEIKGELSNGEKVVIYFNHWSSRRKGTIETEPKRIAAAKVLRSKIDDVLSENAEANIFILGDFNDEPSDNSIKKHLVKKDFANLSSQFEDTKNGTVNHQGDWLVFDQVIASNSAMRNPVFKLTQRSTQIHKTHENTFTHKDGNQTPSRTYGGEKYYGGYSDHYPVYLTLKLKNP